LVLRRRAFREHFFGLDVGDAATPFPNARANKMHSIRQHRNLGLVHCLRIVNAAINSGTSFATERGVSRHRTPSNSFCPMGVAERCKAQPHLESTIDEPRPASARGFSRD
jgi:hypothetical protein